MKQRLIRLLIGLALIGSLVPASLVSAHPPGTDAFERTWARTDLPVAQGAVSRTWMWGPSGYSEAFLEPYADAPGGMRLVQYMDKSRMEDNSYRASAPWDVTNGRLAYELMTGRMQTGDASYEQHQSAQVQVAGDANPDSPTYASFHQVMDHGAFPQGSAIVQTIDRHGTVGHNADLAQYGVTAAYHVPETGHTVASVFWEFMNSSGPVHQNGQNVHAPLFENPWFPAGFPLTEAYWMNVPVGGNWQFVLGQCFERRCLTYTPGNPAGWQVEAGNIGQHYFTWRYGGQPAPPPPTGDVDFYVGEIAAIIELTDITFEAFFFLLDNPVFDDQWFQLFDEVILVWVAMYLYLDTLDPPPGWETFHNHLVAAYAELYEAAILLDTGLYTLDEASWQQGFVKLELFIELFEQAFDHLPAQQLSSTARLSSSSGGQLMMPEFELPEGVPSLPDHDRNLR